jgi:phosphate transport system substrate-binding protein
MRYCINPHCIERENPDQADDCQSCQTPLLIGHRYYLTRSLREEPNPYTEVFLATDVQHPERQKVIKTLISTYSKAVQLFQQEQTLLQQFRHPGIPRGEAAFTVDIPSTGKTLPAFVMEKIDGITLEQWLHEYGTFDQQQAINLLGQMACILDYIHQRHYFHRDIKPSNIMWSHRTGQFVLIDFGSARRIESEQQPAKRQTATMVGTSGYTAPEQWHGAAVPQSDFYALGMTLVHLLTGQHPNERPAHADDIPTLKPIVPRLTNLLKTLTASNPADRPPTARALLHHLTQIDPTLTLYPGQSLGQRLAASHQLNQRFNGMRWQPLVKRAGLRQMVWGAGGMALLGGLMVGFSWVSCTLTGDSSNCALPPGALPPPESSNPVASPRTFAEYAHSTQLPLGRWQYGGSTAWAVIQKRIDPRILVVIPQFQIVSMQSLIPQPSTGKGIEMLIEGKLDFALASRTVNNEEQTRAQARGFYLKQIPVAYDAIGVAVHPDLEIDGLTIDQLVGIYIGRLTNWQQLGGADLPIRALNGDPKGGAPEILKEFFPPGTDYSPLVEIVNNPSDAIQKISNPTTASERGGIYFASANNLIEQCGIKLLAIGRTPTQLTPPYQAPLMSPSQCLTQRQRNRLNVEAIQSGQYPLVRKLFVVVRADDSDAMRVGKAYSDLLLTQEGQMLVQQAGFVPLRSFASVQ